MSEQSGARAAFRYRTAELAVAAGFFVFGAIVIYDSLRLEMVYDHDERAVDAVVKPLGGLVRVSEGGLEPPRPLKGTSTSS